MAICPYCGSQIGDKARICGFCGGKLTLDFTEVPETVAREISEANPIVAESIPEAVAEDEYEGIPDDILGSVLGALPGRQNTPKAEEAPAAPELGAIPEIPTVEELFDIPAVEEVPEAPVAREIPEIPAEETPEIPVAEEVPVIPAAEAVPEIPVPEAAPVIPATEAAPVIPATEEAPAVPAAEQPVYAQPVEKKSTPKWLIPAVAIAALALIGILFFATRGGKSADPNLGVYKATLVEIYSMQLDPDEVYDGGFTIELKADGSCEIDAGGQIGKGTWTLEEDVFTVDDGRSTITGTLSDGTMNLINMLDMGLDMTLEKQE